MWFGFNVRENAAYLYIQFSPNKSYITSAAINCVNNYN